jgi:hypothetical protein
MVTIAMSDPGEVSALLDNVQYSDLAG